MHWEHMCAMRWVHTEIPYSRGFGVWGRVLARVCNVRAAHRTCCSLAPHVANKVSSCMWLEPVVVVVWCVARAAWGGYTAYRRGVHVINSVGITC